MKFFISAACFFLFLLVACENNGGKNIQLAPPANSNILALPVPAKTTTPNTNSNNTILPASVNTAQGKLNPAHGQPDHRCDIAVGAPLNSAPVSTAKKIESFTVPPATTNNAATTPVTAVAPGMNPQHGQPGHRCDIAVGAPLNSAPAKNTNTITPLNTSNTVSTAKTNPPLLPVTSTASNTVTAPGMNPQHGQPGHRCDIAVGAPLNSKPNQ